MSRAMSYASSFCYQSLILHLFILFLLDIDYIGKTNLESNIINVPLSFGAVNVSE